MAVLVAALLVAVVLVIWTGRSSITGCVLAVLHGMALGESHAGATVTRVLSHLASNTLALIGELTK